SGDQDIRPPPYIIGVGGFGVTYRVIDDRGALFAMKEYFPRDHARRANDGRIQPRQSEGGVAQRIFDEGLRRFVAEGQLLASFNHEGVNRVLDAFDANNTSYQIVRLVEGREQLGDSDTGSARIERRVTLEDYLRELERPGSGIQIDLPLIEPVIRQLLDAVEYIHTTGSRKAQEITGLSTKVLIHRDIKPSNILIQAPEDLRDAPAAEIMRDPRTRALLIDFGSARIFREGEESDVSRSIGVVTEGYAPPELSDNQLEQQGPHTDIYSLAAVIWRALLGRKPSMTQLANGAKLADLAAPVRDPSGKDTPRAPRAFLLAVDKALNASISARPQSIAEWRAQLFDADKKRKAPLKSTDGTTEKRARHSSLPIVIAAVLVAAAALSLWAYLSNGAERNIMAQAKAADADVELAMSAANAAIATASADRQAARPQIDPGFAAAKQGSDNYQAYTDFASSNNIHDAAGEGSPSLGDKHGTTEVDGVSVGLWCHKKGPDITPDAGYDTYTTDMANGVIPNATVDGETDWACGIGHTHHKDYDGPQNPFQIVRTTYTYFGNVTGSGDSLIPTGLGQVKFNSASPLDGVSSTGQVTQTGAAIEISGQASFSNVEATGRFRISNLSQSPVFELSGETRLDGKPDFRGVQSRQSPNFKLASWKGWEVRTDGDELLGVLDPHGGDILGRLTHPNGDTWRGLVPTQGASADGAVRHQSWGRLKDSDGEYWGQIVAGKPDGCGVRVPAAGAKAVGFFQAGARQSGAVPESCKTVRYERPFDPAG
ncbi:MAG TPA: serine/threonine-protein kinase, partial [Caulobacteraceae bacterium]|nr:serine/threonine-protein kinase [Caulobacteraceae bacterium]